MHAHGLIQVAGRSVARLLQVDTCAHGFWRVPPVLNGLLEHGNGLVYMQAMQVQPQRNVIQTTVPARQQEKTLGSAEQPVFLHRYPRTILQTSNIQDTSTHYSNDVSMIWRPKAWGMTA